MSKSDLGQNCSEAEVVVALRFMLKRLTVHRNAQKAKFDEAMKNQQWRHLPYLDGVMTGITIAMKAIETELQGIDSPSE